MGHVYHSGAFVQQCFAVHPLCLTVKRYEGTERMVLGCTSCNMSHRLTIVEVSTRVVAVPSDTGVPVAPVPAQSAVQQLTACVADHAPALAVRAVDVVEEIVGLHCADCRRFYYLALSAIETYQR